MSMTGPAEVVWDYPARCDAMVVAPMHDGDDVMAVLLTADGSCMEVSVKP